MDTAHRDRLIDLVFGETLVRNYGNGFLSLAPDRKLVTVVMPAYMHESFVAEAVASVGAQSYPAIEVVLIDDGSSDRTYEVAIEALKALRFPWCALKVRNRGAVVNLNAGVEIAHGGWISLLASDDVYLPEKIAAQIAAGETTRADVVIGLVDEMARDGRLKVRRSFGPDDTLTNPDRAARRLVLEDHFSVMTQGMLFRRNVFSEVGLFSPEIYTEDFDFTIRFLERGLRRACVDMPVARHRQTRPTIDLPHLQLMKTSSLAVVRRHARNFGELRRGRGIILYEAGFNKISYGYPAPGLVDLIAALLYSPIRVARRILARVAGRIHRSTSIESNRSSTK